METKKKKKILNALMVVLSIIVVVGGVIGVGQLKGWFDKDPDPEVSTEIPVCVSKIIGISQIERNGVGFSLKEGDRLKAGDIIITDKLARLELSAGEGNSIILPENSEIILVSSEDGTLSFELSKGSALLNTNIPVVMSVHDSTYKAENAVVHASIQTGSASIHVLGGNAELSAGEKRYSANAGQSIIISDTSSGTEYEVKDLSAEALDEATINSLLASGWTICATAQIRSRAFLRPELKRQG